MNPEYIQVIGIGAGILTSVSMLPQIIKIFKEKKAEDLSVVMILVLISGIIGWIWYGILRNDLPIILTNSFSLLLNLILLFFRFKYADKK
jgi:MtN3 and saliva related transmembrane protein